MTSLFITVFDALKDTLIEILSFLLPIAVCVVIFFLYVCFKRDR